MTAFTGDFVPPRANTHGDEPRRAALAQTIQQVTPRTRSVIMRPHASHSTWSNMQHTGRSKVVTISAGLYVLAVLTSNCSSQKAPPAASRPELWGDLKPVVSVKELMRDMLDPIADNIFQAVKVV